MQAGARALPVNPPLKGAFPLDHDGECKAVKEKYEACLSRNENVTISCRKLAKEYLACRMSRGLMAKEEWKALGLAGKTAESEPGAQKLPKRSEPAGPTKEQRGFVSGLGIVNRRPADAADDAGSAAARDASAPAEKSP